MNIFTGRTNATQLFYQCRDDEYISYVDVVSLYPWAVKWTKYPVGHPEIITESHQPITVDNNPYFGLIRCSILPPRWLNHPVLPYSSSGKLLFPLCKICGDNRSEDYCRHTDEERAITGTWVSTEIDLALKQGYKVCA
ncbi:MAG: hypothetical protein GY696_40255 [Gammaproteobacteria bacterium]|nr:hypothetical protein [Gammaproteobacteria bacterium]